jgi:hypothetical protein
MTASPGAEGALLRLELLVDPGSGGTSRGGVPRRPRAGRRHAHETQQGRPCVQAGRAGVMTRFVSPGGIEVTTPTVDGVQRFRVKDLGGIGGRTRTWLGDYFTEERCTPGWPSWAPTRRGWRRCHRASAPAPCTVTGDHAELRAACPGPSGAAGRTCCSASAAGPVRTPARGAVSAARLPKANHPRRPPSASALP